MATDFRDMKLYQTTKSLKFLLDKSQPYNVVYFSENSTLVEDFRTLLLRPIDFRLVIVPVTIVPRTLPTESEIEKFRKLKLLALSTRVSIPKERNVIYDLSKYLDILWSSQSQFKSVQRAVKLTSDIIISAFKKFPTYKKVLFYSVDLSKDIQKQNMMKRSFSLLTMLKKEEDLPFDNIVLCVLTPNGVRYRLIMKDGKFSFSRIYQYLTSLKEFSFIEDEVESEELEKASKNIVSNIVLRKLISPGNEEKVTSSVRDYLKDKPETVEDVNSKNISDKEVINVATTSILTSVSGNQKSSEKLVDRVSPSKTPLALKTTDKNFSDEMLPTEKSKVSSSDISVQISNVPKIINNKSPEHLFKKRQVDFEVNLKKDMSNSFKVLETKEIPLYHSGIELVDKPSRSGEIDKSDESILRTILSDDFGNKHKIEIEIPKIDPISGTFKLNGKTKCLVNQIVLCPISFPKPYDSKFESTYSTFHIRSKRTRATNLLEIYIASYKLPLLILLSFSFGFEKILNDYGISYELSQTKPRNVSYVSKLDTKNFIIFKNVDSDLKKELVTSFIKENVYEYQITKPFPSYQYFNDLIIKITGRINSTYKIKTNLDNIVDPIARQVLMNQHLPIELSDIMKYMSTKVVQGFVQDRNDLSNQRIRNSEIIVHLAQKQILAAYTNFKEQVLAGNKKAKFHVDPTKVKSDFINSEIVVDMEFGNPLEEMTSLTKVSPVGKSIGGIPGKDSIQMDARNVHDTYFGNIDPLDTPEGPNIGVVQQLSVNALISSARGLLQIKDKKIDERSGILSTSSVMVPFIENNEGARIIMSDNQSRQVLPLKNPEAPIVQSGYESILTNVLSDNFVKRSPCDGKISKIDLDEQLIDVSCGKEKQHVDISPRPLKSGSGKNTLSIFRPVVKENQSVKKGDIIAEGSCINNGTICMGRNLLTAVMPYKGFNFEDGIVINERLVKNEKLTSLHLVQEDVLITEKDRLLFLAKIGSRTERGEPILRKTIGELEELVGFEEDDISEISSGQLIKKSPGGLIVDIEVFSNIDELKHFKLVSDLVAKTNRKYGKPSKDKFTIRGVVVDGILVRFKIQQELGITLGDKLCNRYGNKGIVSLIEPEDMMPRTPWGESLDFIVNPLGIVNRMNIGQLYELYCGLISKELARRISRTGRVEIMKILRQVLPHLDKTKNKTYSNSFLIALERMNETKFNDWKDQIRKNDVVPIIVPAFQAPNHRMIWDAMKLLNLKPKYKLYLPEYNTLTHYEVPVGYQLIQKLEHMGDLKVHARSTGPVTGKVFQPTAGKTREGGQRLGEQESLSFISYNALYTLQELFGPLSDDLITKNEIISDIISTGEAEYRVPKTNPTRDLLHSYFTSLMLENK